MKQTLLLLLLIFSVNAFSQWNGSAGVSITDYSIKNKNQNVDNYQKSGAGFYAKISHTVFLNNFVFIEPGLGFLATETKENIGPGITTTNFIVPIEAGLQVGKYFQINTGLQGNFLISAETTQNGQHKDFKDAYNSSYLNYILGATISPVPEKIHLTFRYTGSFSSVLDDNFTNDTDYIKNVIMVGLKYTFSNPKKEGN